MGVQFWWFYDVIAVAAVLVCIFITVKKGILKALISLIGFAAALGIGFSLSSSLGQTIYLKAVRESNIKKMDQSLSEGDYIDYLARHLENQGYNIYVDRIKLEKICFSGENVDEKIYKYVNNINGKRVDEESSFMNMLHDGYGSVLSNFITKQLSVYSAEYASEQIKSNPHEFHEFLKLLSDSDNHRPAAAFIADNYLREPYTSQIKLVVLIISLILLIVATIFIETSVGRNSYMQSSMATNIISGVMGLLKGAIIVVVIAVMVRLYVVLGNNKMLFFNYDAIDKGYIFKYVYNIIKDM